MRFLRHPVRSQPLWLAATVSCGLFGFSLSLSAGGGQPTVVAWNNLGMHCMDDDYAVFSILPPYNTLNAQVIDSSGHLVTTAGAFTVTYDPIADPTGSINTTAQGKTNFWSYVGPLFGATVTSDHGLAGFSLAGPGGPPQALTFSPAMAWYEATGIPITPWDDAGRYRPYPLVRVVAVAAVSGTRTETVAVLPVSEEMDCRKCHGSNTGAAARPSAGWSNDPVPKRDYRLNVLRLHDERNAGKPAYAQALAAKGMSPQGLYDQVVRVGQPILCAACHASEALAAGGVAGLPALTTAVHRRHATVVAPDTGLTLDATANRGACYQCHPGSATRCLRGAMGSALAADGTPALQCQSCHGSMSQVGAAGRTGWLDEPNCQSCHTGTAVTNSGSIRFLTSLTASGSLRQPADPTFATNPDTPAVGKSLYRFSRGHGGVACSGCHGSTHAEYPSIHPNDNLASQGLQGNIGMISTCTACHPTMPNTVSGGPHGLHPVGQSWVSRHGDVAESNPAACRACHGTDYRGTVLSRALGDRQFSTEWGTRSFWRGQQISCYECHNGPSGERATTFTAPSVPPTLTLATTRAVATSATATLSPATGVTMRVVRPPEHGSVAVNGAVLNYQPDFGYVGADAFTYAASNGVRESNLGDATVTVALGDPAATPAGDGITNAMKYILGLDPTRAVSSGLPVVQVETFGTQRFTTLTASLNPLAAETPMHVEASTDGVTWSPLTDPTLVLNAQPWLLKVRDTVAVTAATPRSLRLVSGSAVTPTGAAGRLSNLSSRATVATASDVVIAGFVLTGDGTKHLLIRAVGPRLADFGITGVLADPVMRIFGMGAAGATQLLSCDNWASEPGANLVISTGAQVGAFPLNGPAGQTNDTRSAACVIDLAAGSYSVQASGVAGGTGTTLVEIYDADAAAASPVRLANISTRSFVADGGRILIGGFVVSGTQARTYLVRGVGPGLAAFNVAGVLSDPRVQVFRTNGGNDQLIASNDNWGGAASVVAAAASVQAFPLTAGSNDAAVVVTLAPGVYTALVSGAPGTSGVALVEIYELP